MNKQATSRRLSVLALFLVGHSTLLAQEPEVPKPAPELQKFAPLIGNWQGSGTAEMAPGQTSQWQSRSTYAWALDNFYVQEDTTVTFADMAKPLVMRSYLGWDAENQHYVAIGVDNDGTVGKARIDIQPDGTMVRMVESFHEGQHYLERYTSKVDGDQASFAIDIMPAMGPSATMVKGTMKRSDKPASMAMNAGAFTATPAPAIAQLAKSAGTFDVTAKMIMMPGMPAMNITGQDVVKPLFDGTIVHVHTTGTAEGSPEQYVGELFYGFDQQHGCVRAVFVSNMGEIGEMTGHFTDDNQSFILTAAAQYMGQPSVQRMVMECNADGSPKKAVGHTMIGTAPPYESWTATYTRKK